MRRQTQIFLCAAILILLVLGGNLAVQASPPGDSRGSPRPISIIQESIPALHEVAAHLGTATAPLPVKLASRPATDPSTSISLASPGIAAPSLSASEENPLSDLLPYAPRGWSYPATPSSKMGSYTANALYAGQPTYLDWAIINRSQVPITTRFESFLYLDGQRIGSWHTEALPPNWYAMVEDYAFVVPTPGWHTIRLVADADGSIGESSEFNNTWEYSFFWQTVSQPNLRPHQPDDWDGIAIPSSEPGTHAANTLYAGQPIFLDWAVVNEGNVATGSGFRTELFLDGVRIATWRTDLLLPNWQAFVEDWTYTVTEPGWHTLRLVTDATNDISESSEEDNAWEGDFFWQAAVKPNLRPHAPVGWDAPLVFSASAGDEGGGALYSGQPVFIDWAISNDSSADAVGRFEHHLYMDGRRIATWPIYGLPKHAQTMSLDWAYLVNTPGWHTFVLVVDATSAIDESDETDNLLEFKVWFQEPESRTVGVEWVNNYFQSGLPPLLHNHINASGLAKELGRVGWTLAFNWGDGSAWEKDFKDRSLGGVDDQVIDAVAFAFFSGHGNSNGLLFDTLEDDYQLSYQDAFWGDGALNWIAVDACLILNNDDGGAVERWGSAFGGLHMILGFDTECLDSPYRGQNLARYADGSYWWEDIMPIKDAWFHAAAVTEDARTYSAALIAVEPGIDPGNDHLPGLGSYSADPSNPTSFVLWRVQN